MLPPGAILQGKYVVERVLGPGGMGAVYLARMPSLAGKRVAIKQMRINITDAVERARAVRQFQSEAHLLALLDHPGLVDVTDALEVSSSPGAARVLVNGQVRGVSPLTLRDLAPGTVEVRADKNGWDTVRQQAVVVKAGETVTVQLTLRRPPAPAKVPTVRSTTERPTPRPPPPPAVDPGHPI